MKKEGGGLQASLLLNPAKHSTSFTPLFNLRRRQAHMFCSVSCCAGLCARALGTCLCFGLLNLLRSPPHPSLSTSSPPPPFVPPCLFPQLPGNAFATESPYGVCSVLCPSNLCPPWTQPRLFWKHHIGCKPHRAPPPQHCLSPRPPPPSLPALPTPTHTHTAKTRQPKPPPPPPPPCLSSTPSALPSKSSARWPRRPFPPTRSARKRQQWILR